MKVSRRTWLATAAAAAIPGRLAAARLVSAGEPTDLHELPTPALLLDLDSFDQNLERMAKHARRNSVDLRPHAKTHKCPHIARRQLEAGAAGVCCATIYEAEVMAENGISGLLITSELVGPVKISRLLELTRKNPDTMSVVDNEAHARELSQAARSAGLTLNLLMDVDPGSKRTGVDPGDPARRLAEAIRRLPGLKLKGVHAYSGASAHVTGWEERRRHSLEAMSAPVATFQELRQDGFPMEILSGASTGTYNIDTEIEPLTELQVGSYLFMDLDYLRIGGKSGSVYEDFLPSLTVLATIISRNREGSATLDSGIKAFASDRKFGPRVKGHPEVEYRFGGDEHGILRWSGSEDQFKLGERVEFIVPHCDPNVNLYDRLYCVRGGKVEDVWPISARGYA